MKRLLLVVLTLLPCLVWADPHKVLYVRFHPVDQSKSITIDFAHELMYELSLQRSIDNLGGHIIGAYDEDLLEIGEPFLGDHVYADVYSFTASGSFVAYVVMYASIDVENIGNPLGTWPQSYWVTSTMQEIGSFAARSMGKWIGENVAVAFSNTDWWNVRQITGTPPAAE